MSPTWDARISGPYIILQNRNTCCAAAHLVLTGSGFTYLGCRDRSGLFEDLPRHGFGSSPRAVILEEDQPPRYGPIEDAWRNFSSVLGEMPEKDAPQGPEEGGLGRGDDLPGYEQAACPSGGGGV